ncbi:MAG: transposase [Chloroflexi bacterium]|nr:transposase [Chloroflexota bacterium]
MESVTLKDGTVYRHLHGPQQGAPVVCVECGRSQVSFHCHRYRSVEHPDPDYPCYLVVKLSKYRCECEDCPRKYFTAPVAEVLPYAHTSARLQQTAKELYRGGKEALRGVQGRMRSLFHTSTGKSSILRWHQGDLAQDYPHPERLEFSKVLCIDEVYDQVEGKRQPIFTCVDPISDITVRILVKSADAEQLAAAMEQLKALGADPKVVVSDLWTAYPEALRKVWPKAERQLCWFHVQQWVLRKLAKLLKEYGRSLPEQDRKTLNRARFALLSSPEHQEKLSEKARAALAKAWELIAGSIVEEALELRNDLRALVNESETRTDATRRFDTLRSHWPERFRPWSWRPGEKLPEPKVGKAEGAEGLHGYLEEIMAFFVRHFEMMITYLGHTDVPRTNNHAERANRRYRAIARPRYGWKSSHGLKAFLITLQGFDST